MEKYEYKEVLADETKDIKCEKNTWKPFWRQVFISSGLWCHYFAVGVSMGTPTIFVPQIRREANSTEAVSEEMASWLSSAFGYTTIPPIFILTYLMSRLGRRKCCILISFSMIGVSIGYYMTTTPVHLLITDVFQGIATAGHFTVSLISLVEYTSPKYRGVMLTIKTAHIFWAIWITNAIGTFTHWRYLCIPSFINSLYSLTAIFWPESPTWLASKGRIEESRKTHRWLKGTSEESERELERMIASQMEYRKRTADSRRFIQVIKNRQFYMPVTLSCLIIAVHQLSGKQVCVMYALDMLKKITKSETTAYTGMLILDGVTVLCMYVGCGLSKILYRRTLLLVFGGIAVVFLFCLSLYLYLCHRGLFFENGFITMALLVGFSIAIGAGPIILAVSLYGELIPPKHYEYSVIIISVFFFLLQATLFKTSPLIFKALDMHGTFFFYGISVTIFLIILYKYLPETKDKTVQEIEDFFK